MDERESNSIWEGSIFCVAKSHFSTARAAERKREWRSLPPPHGDVNVGEDMLERTKAPLPSPRLFGDIFHSSPKDIGEGIEIEEERKKASSNNRSKKNAYGVSDGLDCPYNWIK